MKPIALRFIGGEAHGKLLATRDTQMYRVPVLSQDPEPWRDPLDVTASMVVTCLEQTYRRETIGLGRNTRVDVMVLDTMTEDEKWRRIADLIEGCGKPR